MVWKRLVFIVCLFVIIATAMPQKALAYSVYNEGTLSTTYVTYFRDIVGGVNPDVDYVAYRSGQYSYTLAMGDFSLNGSNISSTGITKLYVYEGTSSGYSQNYSYNVSEVNDFSLNLGNYIVYCNLGDYPLLVERSFYDYSLLLVACVIGLCMFIRSIFAFTYRLRK